MKAPARNPTDAKIPPFRIRFHSPVACALGFLTAKHESGGGNGDRHVVAVVTDDSHLVPAVADARGSGLDARIAWFAGSFSPETSHFCARNGVPALLIEPVTVDSHSRGARARQGPHQGQSSAATSCDSTTATDVLAQAHLMPPLRGSMLLKRFVPLSPSGIRGYYICDRAHDVAIDRDGVSAVTSQTHDRIFFK